MKKEIESNHDGKIIVRSSPVRLVSSYLDALVMRFARHGDGGCRGMGMGERDNVMDISE